VKKIINYSVAIVIAMLLTSCGGIEDEYPPEASVTIEQPPPATPPDDISEYGRRVATEFLREFTTLFIDVGVEEMVWSSDGLLEATGLFIIGWDGSWQPITTDIMPEIWHTYWETQRSEFFNQYGERIYDAPWLDTFVRERDGNEITRSRYAESFSLYDFDGNGIPTIIIHYMIAHEGYHWYSKIFRYIDGEYKLQTGDWSWPPIWFGTRMFWDDSGNIIAYNFFQPAGEGFYHQIVFTDQGIDLHLLAELDAFEDDFHAWLYHHNVLFHDPAPTIIGTDISLIPIERLFYLESAIAAEITAQLGGTDEPSEPQR